MLPLRLAPQSLTDTGSNDLSARLAMGRDVGCGPQRHVPRRSSAVCHPATSKAVIP